MSAREAAMISEIRRACGITELIEPSPGDLPPDEAAADIASANGAADIDDLDDFEDTTA